MIHFTLRSVYLNFEFQIENKVTLIVEDSGTGKTELFRLLLCHKSRLPGVEVICDIPVVVITGNYGYRVIERTKNSLVFIDGPNNWLDSDKFCESVLASSNYYVMMWGTKVSLFKARPFNSRFHP